MRFIFKIRIYNPQKFISASVNHVILEVKSDAVSYIKTFEATHKKCLENSIRLCFSPLHSRSHVSFWRPPRGGMLL